MSDAELGELNALCLRLSREKQELQERLSDAKDATYAWTQKIFQLEEANNILTKQLVSLKSVLRDHWITSVNCDKLGGTNRASCSCSAWRGHVWTSVDGAVDDWIRHVFDQVTQTDEKV